eukprot:TRINITY_DN11781_c0_g1_i4.p3 TRINITY_DN11781_c0_g1~~TRINITY_DN11781_c0_g1_i4.p3  ORF type:complete len:293 (+),score=37.34 TRINITY_DN11781_c0_g1_i4:51-929(+)
MAEPIPKRSKYSTFARLDGPRARCSASARRTPLSNTRPIVSRFRQHQLDSEYQHQRPSQAQSGARCLDKNQQSIHRIAEHRRLATPSQRPPAQRKRRTITKQVQFDSPARSSHGSQHRARPASKRAIGESQLKLKACKSKCPGVTAPRAEQPKTTCDLSDLKPEKRPKKSLKLVQRDNARAAAKAVKMVKRKAERKAAASRSKTEEKALSALPITSSTTGTHLNQENNLRQKQPLWPPLIPTVAIKPSSTQSENTVKLLPPSDQHDDRAEGEKIGGDAFEDQGSLANPIVLD